MMSSRWIKVISLTAGLVMLSAAAMADSISFSGKVTASRTAEVYAPIGGTVDQVKVQAGQEVTEDTVLYHLKTNKVYASEDGTVTGIFGRPGDNAADVTAKYGAVMYLEGKESYTISASTDNAYNATENKYVHVGEAVYLVSRKNKNTTGIGYISSISGKSYNVSVTAGSFTMGTSVDIYRGADHARTSCIGRGTVSRYNPTAVNGTGSIVSIAVENGASVKRGDLLMETLDGSFDGLYMSGAEIYADCNGVVAQLNCAQGSVTQKNGVVAVIYPNDAMRIEGTIHESNLADIRTGDHVTIEMNWNEDTGKTYEGVVSMISSMANMDSMDGATYTVYIDFTPDSNTKYGMTATVMTLED